MWKIELLSKTLLITYHSFAKYQNWSLIHGLVLAQITILVVARSSTTATAFTTSMSTAVANKKRYLL